MNGANDQPLFEFVSHVVGKNAKVQIYGDRIEWEKKGIGRHAQEMIPIRSITSVSLSKSGFKRAVQVITSGNTIDFRTDKNEADQARRLIADLMLGKHPAQQSTPPDQSWAPPSV